MDYKLQQTSCPGQTEVEDAEVLRFMATPTTRKLGTSSHMEERADQRLRRFLILGMAAFSLLPSPDL